ncbi:MAG: aminotransferase class I/II-fold pyridoxal phosphate-dependent enzyme [Candidatus Thorarchaeota archaeon]|nr:MAG: aminotransferase class I/II-fold pyridoxal phosphate-dependent enzyme [Candidatus Thorarchaeota archaeon]
MKTIDLRSDTVTKPTDEMIEAIVRAHKEDRFGDDVIGEDTVVHELQDKAAKILGKEAALLVTSGTQGNVVSLLAQAKPGEEVVVEERSHSYIHEAGAMASLGGLYPKPVKGDRGYITPETLKSAISIDNPHYAKTTMVIQENTHNASGGAIIGPEQFDALADVAHENGLAVHCDGARLFNAAVALDIPAKRLVERSDSVMVCLSKGLSAPVGSIVAGTEDFIYKAHRARKRLGGGMRQAGLIAAPGIVALESMVERLREDHENTQLLYSQLSRIPDLIVEEPETNILFIRLDNLKINSMELETELKKRNILVYGDPHFGTRTRLVVHRMVSKEDILHFANEMEDILGG